ncbi:MAG: DNA-3-methyladenine glycosylase I [Hyphomicrobiales bacterium]
MRSFDEIYTIAAKRKGGSDALSALLEPPFSQSELLKISDDRWLSMMTKCVFQAGFSWKVIEAKWDGFETAFEGFDIGRCLFLNDEDMEQLLSNKDIVRNGMKIKTVQQNATFVAELAKEHGSAASFFANWPSENYIGLLELLKKRGSRLGGSTAQYFLRFMGVDSFVLSRDVVARLIAEGVVDKNPTSKSAMKAVQSAFNTWSDQSGRSLKEISRTLAMSVD